MAAEQPEVEDPAPARPGASGKTRHLPRTRRSHLASDTLLSRIVRGVWKAGDRLPSERQLSEELGMSRASIREAIRGLEAMGLVDVRHGQGVFVRQAAEGDSLFSGWRTDHGYPIGELLAFRLLVEPELAALAADNADDAFVQHLELIMAGMETAAAAGDLPALVQLDTAFHDAITAHAGSGLYRDLLKMVGSLLVDSRRISLSVPGRAMRVVGSHNAVVDAIRRREPRAAADAMRDHLDGFARDMRVRPLGPA